MGFERNLMIANSKPLSKINNQNSQNLPIYSRISALGKNIKVIPPRRLLPQLLLSDEKQGHRNPRLQPTTYTPNLWTRHRVRIYPELLGHLQNDLVPPNVPLSHQPQAFRNYGRLHQRLFGGDEAFLGDPFPEGSDGLRQLVGFGWEDVGSYVEGPCSSFSEWWNV